MSHKLKPTDLTSLLLKSNFEFSWGNGKDRIIRYDNFVNQLKAKFAIVDWGQCNGSDSISFIQRETSNQSTNDAKKDLMALCAGPQLRDIIDSTICDEADTFDKLTQLIRKKLMKDTPPLLQLATLLSEQQGFAESFEDYFNRVKVAANSIDWEAFTPENAKNALIATTLASRSHNPYVKGHCLAVRSLDSINLQDILNTAQEYEEKNPAPASFPQTGNSGPRTSLFGSGSNCGSGSGGGSFGAQPTGNESSVFGSKTVPLPVKCTNRYIYDKDGNLDPNSTNAGCFGGFSFGAAAAKPSAGTSLFGSSSTPTQAGSAQSQAPAPNSGPTVEENRGLFAIDASNNAPFGGRGFKTNIFMSDKKGAVPKEGEASTSQPSTELEGETSGANRAVKRQRSEGGSSENAQ